MPDPSEEEPPFQFVHSHQDVQTPIRYNVAEYSICERNPIPFATDLNRRNAYQYGPDIYLSSTSSSHTDDNLFQAIGAHLEHSRQPMFQQTPYQQHQNGTELQADSTTERPGILATPNHWWAAGMVYALANSNGGYDLSPKIDLASTDHNDPFCPDFLTAGGPAAAPLPYPVPIHPTLPEATHWQVNTSPGCFEPAATTLQELVNTPNPPAATNSSGIGIFRNAITPCYLDTNISQPTTVLETLAKVAIPPTPISSLFALSPSRSAPSSSRKSTCSFEGCTVTCGRPADLNRHKATLHAKNADGKRYKCERYKNGCIYASNRYDKLRTHCRNVNNRRRGCTGYIDCNANGELTRVRTPPPMY
ncbi:hypothetical protein LTR08_001146 [Meristemomyces frigidus]|nr:hypothetical protein LTR08_001146 [Meristemomyces frigidus]